MPLERGSTEIEVQEALGEIAVGSIRGVSNPVIVWSDVHTDRVRALTRRAAVALASVSGPAESIAVLDELLGTLSATLDAYAVVRNIYYGGPGAETAARIELEQAERALSESLARLTALSNRPR
jgi:hypothetical protein